MTNFRLNLSTHEILSCSFSKNGDTLISGDSCGMLSVVKNDISIKIKKFFKIHKSSINRILCDSDYICTASSDSTCKIWKIETSHILKTLNLGTENPFDIDLVDNLIVTSGDKGNMKLWDLRIRNSVGNIFHGVHLSAAKFLDDSFSIVSCGVFPELFFWDMRNFKKKCKIFSLKGHGMKIQSFCLSRSDFSFYSLGCDGAICRWVFTHSKNSLKCRFFGPIKTFSSLSKPNFLKVSCDSLNRFIGHGGPNGIVYLRYQRRDKLIEKKKIHVGAVNQVNFHPEGRIFCSCGEDGFLSINKLPAKNLKI